MNNNHLRLNNANKGISHTESSMKSFLFLLLTLSTLFTNVAVADSDDAKRCLDRWSHMADKFNEGIENMNNGFSIIGRNPEASFNYLNKAHSLFMAYQGNPMDIYLDCRNDITLTESQAQETRKMFIDSQTRASCGMVLAPAVRNFHGVNSKVEEYNDAVDNYPGQVESIGRMALIMTRANQTQFNTMIKYTPACNSNGDLVEYAGQYVDFLKEYEAFFKRFE